MPNDRFDWRADIRARIAPAGLHPQDEADVVEEVAQHLEAQFTDLAPRIGAGQARARLRAQLGPGAMSCGWRRSNRVNLRPGAKRRSGPIYVSSLLKPSGSRCLQWQYRKLKCPA